MEQFTKLLQDLSSWYWWVTVVVVGLLLNIGSAYLKSPIDRGFSALFDRWRNLSAQRRQIFDAQVQYLASNPNYLILAVLDELRNRARSTIYFLFTSILFAFTFLIHKGEAGISSELRRSALSIAIFFVALGYASFLETFFRSMRQTELNRAAERVLRECEA